MAEVNHAYELLSDGTRRAAWDAAHPVQMPRAAPGPGPSRGPGAPPRDRGASEPTLEDALAFVLTFGKFRSRTLGYVAAVEPGYLAWIVRTIGNRPDLVRHARLVLAHLESSGWTDTPRPPRPRPRPRGRGNGAPVRQRGPARAGTRGTPDANPASLRPGPGRGLAGARTITPGPSGSA